LKPAAASVKVRTGALVLLGAGIPTVIVGCTNVRVQTSTASRPRGRRARLRNIVERGGCSWGCINDWRLDDALGGSNPTRRVDDGRLRRASQLRSREGEADSESTTGTVMGFKL
jgi:hypothetical protein